MKMLLHLLLLIFMNCVLLSSISATRNLHIQIRENFHQCLISQYYQTSNTSLSNVVYTPKNSSYESVLKYPIHNLRFTTDETPKPDVVITPVNEQQIQQVIYCAKRHGMEIRIRSGGHDFEGLSSVSEVPFAILDLTNFRSIEVDVDNRKARVQVGASLGDLYYRISEKSKTLGFAGGNWASVCVGGIISGGGFGVTKRKYGMAADNVLDARVIDANGRILDRESMGEDFFWAIRGGGGSSFGVITEWTLNLVELPEKVTVFQVQRYSSQNVTELLYKWQIIAPKLPNELYLGTEIKGLKSKGVYVDFQGMFVGNVTELIPIMDNEFPELGVTKDDYTEMSWIEAILYYSGLENTTSTKNLLNRDGLTKAAFKSSSDYVTEPIPKEGLEGLFKLFDELDPDSTDIVFSPYGGIYNEIPESAIPFPHRSGMLYSVLKQAIWNDGEEEEGITKRVNWIHRVSEYLTPYVSKNPRRAYLNYNDLDFGVNTGKYEDSYKWGVRYFNKNFERLVKVKGLVDPHNFFKHEQSIPLPPPGFLFSM